MTTYRFRRWPFRYCKGLSAMQSVPQHAQQGHQAESEVQLSTQHPLQVSIHHVVATPFQQQLFNEQRLFGQQEQGITPQCFQPVFMAIEQGEVPNCLLHQFLKKLCSRCVRYRALISANRYRRTMKMRAALQVSLFNTKRVALTQDIAVLQKKQAELIDQVHAVEALTREVSSRNAMLQDIIQYAVEQVSAQQTIGKHLAEEINSTKDKILSLSPKSSGGSQLSHTECNIVTLHYGDNSGSDPFLSFSNNINSDFRDKNITPSISEI